MREGRPVFMVYRYITLLPVIEMFAAIGRLPRLPAVFLTGKKKTIATNFSVHNNLLTKNKGNPYEYSTAGSTGKHMRFTKVGAPVRKKALGHI